jgi:hypothetical protein
MPQALRKVVDDELVHGSGQMPHEGRTAPLVVDHGDLVALLPSRSIVRTKL